MFRGHKSRHQSRRQNIFLRKIFAAGTSFHLTWASKIFHAVSSKPQIFSSACIVGREKISHKKSFDSDHPLVINNDRSLIFSYLGTGHYLWPGGGTGVKSE